MRITGIETEYGIADRDHPRANPILMSSRLVNAYRDSVDGLTTFWDYGAEDPLQDARGHRRDRATASEDMLTDAPAYSEADDHRAKQRTGIPRRRRGSWEDPAHLNIVLTNGARFYVDHAHPEYSGPEVTNARDAVIWDRAGDEIARRAAAQYTWDGDGNVALYKNNVDGKGASYGTHENFLVDRSVPFGDLARRMTAHLVTRQIYTGAGRVGIGQRGQQPGFQLSQRADYIEAEVGLETTLRRPIINTRDEPHANPHKWRRLHVIIGDANCMDVPTFMKVGTTSLVLSAIEADDDRLDALQLADPVEATTAVSHDLSLRLALPLVSGETATALDLQRALLEIARDYAADAVDALVIARWESLLERLRRDPMECAADVEWAAKLKLFTRMRERNGEQGVPTPWDDARLAAADLQWSDLDPARGLAARLEKAGAIERIATDAEIASAVTEAPQDTRAAVRGAFVRDRQDVLDAAGWETLVVDDGAQLSVHRLSDPHSTAAPDVATPSKG